MKNINYSPQLRIDFLRPNYSYTNVINFQPQINLYHQKQSLSGIKIQNYNNNVYNGIISYTPYLTRNYSTSFVNVDKLNLNQLYRQTSPLINNSNININTIYDNKSNSFYNIFKKNDQGIFYSPQTKNSNININTNKELINLKLNRSNQIYDRQNMNLNMTQIMNKNLFPNLSYNNLIPNKNNINNKNPQYFINNKKDKIQKIEIIEPLKKSNLTNDLSITKEKSNNLGKIENISQLLSPVKSSNDISTRIDNEEPKENFDPSEFTIIKRIGEGTYGKIYLAQWKKNNKKYAMKKEIIKGSESLKKNKEKTKIVINFIKKTKSKGVIKIYGDLVKKKVNEYHYYVLMEMADRDWEKELFERQKYKQFYSEKELFKIMNQLIKTLSLLQKNHITHRDIKPQNVLISKGIYKISDFGEARTLIRQGIIVSRVRGTELYMSPILFQGLRLKLVQVSHNTFKSDVFSFGMCLFFASTLTFNSICDIRELDDMKLIKEKLIKYLSGRYSFKLINILYEMLQVEENNRPDFLTLEKKYFS